MEGVSITLFERLQKLSQSGHSVLCLVSSYEQLEDIYPNWSNYVGSILDNVEIVPLPSQRWMGVERERNPLRSSIAIIDRALERFKPDIIQVEEPERLWTTMFSLPGLSYARHYRIPCIASYRTNFIDYLPDYIPEWAVDISKFAVLFLNKWIYNQYTNTLVGSKFMAARLKSWGINNINYARVIGSQSVSNPEKLRQTNFWQNSYGLSEVDDTVKILFLGRLSPDKNWEFNCQYLPQLKQQPITKKYSIILAGKGELEADLQQSTFARELSPIMLGEIPRDRILPLLANVDLHVTSSLKETFGRTVQESLSVGTPVLAPDCPWTRNLVTPDFDGVLYKAQDGRDFILKLTELIEGSDTRALLRANAYSSLERSSNQQDPASEWIEYLQNQIQK